MASASVFGRVASIDAECFSFLLESIEPVVGISKSGHGVRGYHQTDVRPAKMKTPAFYSPRCL